MRLPEAPFSGIHNYHQQFSLLSPSALPSRAPISQLTNDYVLAAFKTFRNPPMTSTSLTPIHSELTALAPRFHSLPAPSKAAVDTAELISRRAVTEPIRDVLDHVQEAGVHIRAQWKEAASGVYSNINHEQQLKRINEVAEKRFAPLRALLSSAPQTARSLFVDRF